MSRTLFNVAFFNMLPFSGIDSKKVLAWDKGAFAGIIILILLVWLA